MASLYALILSALVFDTGLSYILDVDDRNETLVLPSEYHFKGDKVNLASGIIEPFEIWYSAKLNKSRIDYFDGTVKKYYIGDSESETAMYTEVLPIWTEETKLKVACAPLPSDEGVKNFLPKGNFTYVGDTEFSGREVEIWKSSEILKEDFNVDETILVYRDGDVYVPLRYERQQHYMLNGALYKHYVLLYQDYSQPNPEQLEAKNDKACKHLGVWGKDFHNDLEMLHPDISFDVDEAFERYKKHHNKDYSYEDHELRKNIFRENWKHIQKHNSKNLSYKMGLNEFSDRSPEELAYLTATRFEGPIQGTEEFLSDLEVAELAKDLPENFDLRIEGYISRVKYQAECGSCWAFASTAALEGALTRSNGGRRLDLSEQSLVDCSWGYRNGGCDGGLLSDTFKYILKYGIPTEEEYGLYMAKEGYCHIENMTDVYRIRGFASVTELSVNAMKVALVKYGPVAIGVHASENMMKYASGIFYEPECNRSRPNHAVVVVGYGVRDGALYWIIKNSWGEQWGEDGYMLISATDNNCHVLEYAMYFVV